MKIAMLTEWREPLVWWWQVYAKYLCDFLVRTYGCKIDVFTRAFIDDNWEKVVENKEYAPGWMVYRIWPVWSFFSSLYRIASLFKTTIVLYKKAKQEKYDIIHAHALLAWLPAWIVGKMLHIPVVYTVHGTMHMDVKKKWLFYYAEKFLVAYIPYDLEISVSHKVLDHNPRSKRVVIIYPGIDKAKYLWTCPKYDGMNYLFVGRIDRQKWLSYLVKAIGNIDVSLLDNQKFHLNILGDGPDRKDIESLVDEVERRKYITFLWKTSFERIVQEYKSNQLFILPSLAEWQPVVVFEAFANKLPVIVTDVWDNSYIINKDNGFLVPPWNIDELQKVIEKTLTMDIQDLEQMWMNWYTMTQERFWREIIVAQIYSEYKILLHDFNHKHKK